MNPTTIDHADELERLARESRLDSGVLIGAYDGLTLEAAAKELRRLRGEVASEKAEIERREQWSDFAMAEIERLGAEYESQRKQIRRLRADLAEAVDHLGRYTTMPWDEIREWQDRACEIAAKHKGGA